ncbi:hypothetical protein ACFPH6_06690 [Streptomyces xiangluensis]|uniref:Uncharacterized protein n=1 Tax=Streptomyces xiangluensis TaxID=2665720 RepID=A0ABV8YIV8_9ACTN
MGRSEGCSPPTPWIGCHPAPYAAAIAEVTAASEEAPQVSSVVGPEESGAVSAGRTAAIVQVQYAVQHAQVSESSVHALEKAADAAQKDGL